ncbi:replicative DNA helicase [Mycoplasma simbae]|uniref:replicative DNA helicase n=1 Tax=Mycoplasma simbae TaxID=36744 RepID=UPI000497578F|nr:replicative DNA helicase [Mycoplasma simbae]
MSSNSEHTLRNSIHINSAYEQNVLGVVLSNNEYADSVLPYLLEEDFAIIEHKRLFVVISYLYNNNISINNQQILNLAAKTNEKLVTPALLSDIYANSGLPANIQIYLEELIRLTRLRALEAKVNELQVRLSKLDKSLQPDDIVQDIQKLLIDIDRAKNGEDFLTAKSVSDEYAADLYTLRSMDMDSISGTPTGYDDLDRITQGMHGAEMIILAARPGIGKTALALNIAVNVSQQNKKNSNRKRRVAFFSLEMPPKQLMGRIYSMVASVDQFKLKKPQLLTDEDVAKINAIKHNKIDKLNLFIDNTYENELQTLLWKCRRLHKVEPLDLIVVDYMQLIHSDKKGGSDNRQMEITRISRSLKTLALELNVPIIVLSQLNRQTELREDKRPNLSDLRESGSIENDADMVIFLYRENYYNSKNKNINTGDFEGKDLGEPIELIIAKHRGGQTGKIDLRFVPHLAKFTNINFYKPTEKENNF